MRKMRKKAISIVGCTCVAAVGLMANILVDSSKVGRAETSVSANYEETYEVGETLVVQAAEFDYAGEKYAADAVVRFPGGNAYKYDEVVLTSPGKYYVDYSAVANDGTLLQESKAFTVLANVYSVEGKGEYSYGSNAYLADEVKGVNVSLARNAMLTINTPIDVSDLGRDDTIFKFYATPNTKGIIEAGVVYVRLTDAHDENKYVEWQYRPKASFQYVYASANGQHVTGLKYAGSPESSSVEYDGYYYDLAHNIVKNAGHISRASFSGEMDGSNENYLKSKYFSGQEYTEQEMFFYNSIECRMDYREKRLYSQPDGQYAIDRCVLADFDDERTLGGRAPWEGFTTGEAFISVYAADYATSNFNFFITEIHGQDVSKTTMINELAPRVTVDTGDYELDNLPNAIVGKKYNLFNGFATDDADGVLDVHVKVYNSIGAMVSVKNGSFTPTRAGIYTIEYTAKDSFENETVKTVKVKAINRASLEYELSEAKTEFKAGEVVSVKELTLRNPSNLYDLKIVAKNAEQGVEYLMDVDNLTFTPLYAGTYTVTYAYSDYCTQEEITYDIEVTSSDLVVFEDDIVLPRYIIKGLPYPVVPMHAYTFANSTQTEFASLYVKEGDGEERLVDGDTYFVQGDVPFATLIYKVSGKQQTYKIPVVSAVDEEYKVDLAKYFYSTVGEFKATSDAKKIKFEAVDSVDGVAKLEVINPARLINDFNIGFHFETATANFTAAKVVFESAYDSDKKVEFKFERDIANVAKVCVSSQNFSTQSGIFSQFRTPVTQSDNFSITYNSTTKEFDLGGFIVSTRELLKDFDDLFYISFELHGISGDAAINITRVVNQQINNEEYDGVKPIALYGSYKGYYAMGDEMKVNAVRVYDFVDPNPVCSLSLQNTLGYLSSDDIKLDGKQNDYNSDYLITVTKVSRMNLKISCEDFSMNNHSINLPIMVKDMIAPNIQLNVVNNLYKAGDKVTIADYIVEDDTTAQADLSVSYYLIASDGKIEYLPKKSFEIEKAGEYVVYYIVRDEAGNNAYARYTIFVE